MPPAPIPLPITAVGTPAAWAVGEMEVEEEEGAATKSSLPKYASSSLMAKMVGEICSLFGANASALSPPFSPSPSPSRPPPPPPPTAVLDMFADLGVAEEIK